MSPRVVDRAEKKKALALAAIPIFGRKGFDKTRMDDVAKAIGVGKGTLYDYFEDKESLLEGAFEALMEGFFEEMMPAEGDEDLSALETLRLLARGTIDALAAGTEMYAFFLEYLLHQSRSEKPSSGLQGLLTMYRGGISAILEKGIDKGELRPDIDVAQIAAAFAAWFDGAVFHKMVMPASTDLALMTSAFLDAYERGIVST